MLLCILAIGLSIAVFPIKIFNTELLNLFNALEVDIFNYARMWIVSAMGIFCVWSLTSKRRDYLIAGYLLLLTLSTLTSRFPETALYSSPLHHEGFLALLGYVGIFEVTRRTGVFKNLEKCFSFAIYFTAATSLAQFVFSAFNSFNDTTLHFMGLEFVMKTWPIYGNLGGANNLGLFCALFIPWALVRNKKKELACLTALLFVCETRAAWLAGVITALFISRRYCWILALAACLTVAVKPDIVWSRLKRSVHEIHYPLRDSDLAGRGFMWMRSSTFLKDSIFLGKGPGTYLMYFPQLTTRGQKVLENLGVDRPHNMFLNIWEASGLLSAIVVTSILIKTIICGNDMALKLGIIGFIITGFFTDSVLCVTPYCMMFLGGLSYEYDQTRRYAQRKSGAGTDDHQPGAKDSVPHRVLHFSDPATDLSMYPVG